MQEHGNVRDELEQTQLNTIEHNLNRLIEHRADTMDILTLEDFSSKALLTSSLSDTQILELLSQVKESVIEQRTLEASYRQLLLNLEAGLTDLINKYSDLKEAIEAGRARWQDGQQDVNSHSNADDILREYWGEFKEYFNNQGISLEPVTWNRNTQYFGFRLSIKSVSDRDIWLAAWCKPDQTQIAVNLSLRLTDSGSEDAFDALETFNALEKKKEVIENAFGGNLRWQEEPFFSSLGPVVGVYKSITPDRDDWQRQFEWMFTILEKLNQVFRPFVRECLQIGEQIDWV